VTGLAVRLKGVVHDYHAEGEQVHALRGVDLDVPAGASHVVVGPSGSGKSTVLHLLAGLARPTAGELWVGDSPVHALAERQLRELRSDSVAVLLQSPGQTLLPYASARENVELVRRRGGRRSGRDGRPTAELLDRLGLAAVAERPVAGLSGGEQQRVAIAACLVHRPGLVLADEPTSQLDRHTRDEVLALLDEVRHEFGATLLMTTHDPALTAHADAVSQMVDGRLTTLRETAS
jgi:putative ABC transport system ATP-binding protein